MDYLTANEAALKWGISSRMVAYYCKAGRIDGAVKKGKTWFIPSDAEKPVDRRNRGNGFKREETYGVPYAENERAIDSIYHTNDVANSLGLTRETLRYYEEMGLITPKRSGDSKYREQIRQIQRLSKVNKWLMGIIAKRLGCTERLDAMPYDK